MRDIINLASSPCLCHFHINAGPKIRVCNGKLFFLFLSQNICCGYSKELSHWDGSFEHTKHMFNLTDRKIIAILCWKNCLTGPMKMCDRKNACDLCLVHGRLWDIRSLYISTLCILHMSRDMRFPTIWHFLTWIDSDEPLQPPCKLRNSKWCLFSSFVFIT